MSLLVEFLAALGIAALGVLTFYLYGMYLIVKDQTKKLNILVANYKSDLEMALLHAHNFNEFIASMEKQMQQHEGEVILPPAGHTYR